jgi:hypothetical protein
LQKGWGYILAVFYFEIEPNFENVDTAVWIVVGDLPTAYIDTESAKNKYEAIKCYVGIMEDWVKYVKEGKPLKNVYPVNVTPTIENAVMLETRLKLIKEELL